MNFSISKQKMVAIVFFFFLLPLSLLRGQGGGNRLRVASYNVWNPVFEEKYSGKNTWGSRVKRIIQTIRDADPDIICLQEVGLDNYLDLISILGGEDRYLSFYHPHAKSNPSYVEGRDGLAILLKPNLVENVAIQTSDGKERPTHRRDFWVDIKAPGSEERVRVATTHLDSSKKDLELGNTQLKNLLNDVTKNRDSIGLIVVCGDFNEGENEAERPRAQIMKDFEFITDGSTKPTRPESLNVRHKGHVDWIYFKKINGALKLKVEEGDSIGDATGSDHKLTYTDFILE